MSTSQQPQALKKHPQLKAIEKDIVSLVPIRVIAEKFNVSEAALYRHKKKNLVEKCSKAIETKKISEGTNVLELLSHYMENVNILSDACIDQLRDPQQPDKLFLGATAADIQITYISDITESGREIKSRDSLQNLLDKINDIDRIEIKSPDRAKTLIEASRTMNKHIHLFAELKGMLGPQTGRINERFIIDFTQSIIDILSPYPEARKEVVNAVKLLSEKHNIDEGGEND